MFKHKCGKILHPVWVERDIINKKSERRNYNNNAQIRKSHLKDERFRNLVPAVLRGGRRRES